MHFVTCDSHVLSEIACPRHKEHCNQRGAIPFPSGMLQTRAGMEKHLTWRAWHGYSVTPSGKVLCCRLDLSSCTSTVADVPF